VRKLISENIFNWLSGIEKFNSGMCNKIFLKSPEAINQMIYCNMAMNVLKENERFINGTD